MAPCCIKGCQNRGEKRSKKNSGITYHLFPRDMVKRLRWVSTLGRPSWMPSNATVVCSDHFTPSSFYSTQHGLKRLVDDAVPTINTNNQVETRGRDAKDDVNRLEAAAAAGDEEAVVALAGPLASRLPPLTQNEHPKTRQLAAQLLRLLLIYEKQKKKLRNLRQKLRRQDAKLEDADRADHKTKCQRVRRKRNKIEQSDDFQLDTEKPQCPELNDPLECL